jgi:hypothetical protein
VLIDLLGAGGVAVPELAAVHATGRNSDCSGRLPAVMIEVRGARGSIADH